MTDESSFDILSKIKPPPQPKMLTPKKIIPNKELRDDRKHIIELLESIDKTQKEILRVIKEEIVKE
jgi:hypothetical protein